MSAAAPLPNLAAFAAVRDLRLLLEQAEPRVRRAFLRAVAGAQLELPLAQVARLLEAGRLLEAAAVMERVAPAVHAEVQAAYAAAGVNAAAAINAQLARRAAPVTFDLLNARAVTSLQSTRLRLVRELTQEARSVALVVMQAGVDRGLAPVAIARELRASLGLTARQAQSVQNYRRLLEQGSAGALRRQLRDRRFDRAVLAAAEGRRALTADQIDRMVERYRQRMVAHRAATVANTEALRAVHAGEQEMWEQAVASGQVARDDVVAVWRTASDEKVRPSHAAMNGQARSLGQPFRSGAGNALLYPGDPDAPAGDTVRCRCVLQRRVRRPRER